MISYWIYERARRIGIIAGCEKLSQVNPYCEFNEALSYRGWYDGYLSVKSLKGKKQC